MPADPPHAENPTTPSLSTSLASTPAVRFALQWLKHTASVVVASVCVGQLSRGIYELLRASVRDWSTLPAIWHSVVHIPGFHLFGVVYLLANILRYLLASFAWDVMLTENPNPQARWHSHLGLFLGGLLDTLFTLVLVLALGVAAASIRDATQFAFCCLAVVSIDLVVVLTQRLVAFQWKEVAADYRRWLRNWIAIDAIEVFAWFFLLLEVARAEPRGSMVFLAGAIITFFFLADLVWNRDFWTMLAKYSVTDPSDKRPSTTGS